MRHSIAGFHLQGGQIDILYALQTLHLSKTPCDHGDGSFAHLKRFEYLKLLNLGYEFRLSISGH